MTKINTQKWCRSTNKKCSIKCHFNIWWTTIAAATAVEVVSIRQPKPLLKMTRQKGKQRLSYHVTNIPFTLGAATVVYAIYILLTGWVSLSLSLGLFHSLQWFYTENIHFSLYSFFVVILFIWHMIIILDFDVTCP